jgi:hypothetical protein
MSACRRTAAAVAAASLLGLGAVTGESAGASSWTPAVREKMAGDATKVAPPALARIILRHPDALLTGIAEATLSEGSARHRQEGDAAGEGAAVTLREAAERAVAALDGHRPMSDVVHDLGVVAHIAADLDDPLLTTPAGADAAFASDFAIYVERNLMRFPVVFYGYLQADPNAAAGPQGGAGLDARPLGAPSGPAAGSASSEIEAQGLASAARARGYFPHIAQAYAGSGGTSKPFDVRSLPFGVASICYSRAVTDIARAWLNVWISAHGDLTGTPYLPGAPAAPAALPPVERSASVPRPSPGAVPAADRPRVEPAGSPPEAAGLDAEADPESRPDPDPNAPTINKVILGKSRKRLGKNVAQDPNHPDQARDPNSMEKNDASNH